MLSRHRVSRAAIELIKRFEGYRRSAAQLPDGRWTIGYGHTLTAREGAEVSEPDAEALLVYDLIAVQHAVNEGLLAPVDQNQFDALCSFTFNIGIDNFRRSQVLKRLNAGSAVQAACAMELWRKADFEGERIVVDALVRRRAAEKALFLSPADGAWTPAPSPLLRPVIDLDALDLVPLRRPVAVETSFQGDKVVARREDLAGEEPVALGPDVEPEPGPEPTPEPVAAVTVAAEAVVGRLESIFPAFDEEPGSEVALEAEADVEGETEGEAQVLRPQADFAPPITEHLEAAAPSAELADDRAPELEPEQQPEPKPDAEPAPDTAFEIPQAPLEARHVERAPEPVDEAQPYEFIPARSKPALRPREPSVLWDLLLSLLGLAFFGFGVFWGWSARAAPAGAFVTPFMVAWSAGLAGVGFVAVAVYRLMQRLGREAEQD